MDLKLGLRPKCKHCCLEIISIIAQLQKYQASSKDIIGDNKFQTQKSVWPKIKFILRHCNLGADHVERGYI